MSNDTPADKETDGDEPTDDELAAKRARFEAFEFRVPTAGRVRVENTSYGDESDEHVYVVEVAEHVGATACTCPSDEYRSGVCKHRQAVENAAPVMLAATEGLSGAFPESDRDGDASASSVETHPIAADGGQVADGDEESSDDGEGEGETCDRCPALLADVHATHEATTVTTDGEELCPECADARSGEEVGFIEATVEGDDTERERPTRSEPADFGGGEASGMDQL